MGVKFDRMKDGYNRYQVDALIEELNMHISSLERSNEALPKPLRAAGGTGERHGKGRGFSRGASA